MTKSQWFGSRFHRILSRGKASLHMGDVRIEAAVIAAHTVAGFWPSIACGTSDGPNFDPLVPLASRRRTFVQEGGTAGKGDDSHQIVTEVSCELFLQTPSFGASTDGSLRPERLVSASSATSFVRTSG
jgi:hypothetical protein